MPRDSSGQYQLPPNIEGVPLEVIESADWNNFTDDVQTDLNFPRPVVAGGQGANSAVGGSDNLSTISTPIIAASLTDLSAASGVHVTITGSTTITGFGTEQAGAMRYVTLEGSPLLTYNSTSLIMPTAANIQGASGDKFILVSLGSGNWTLINYQKFDGTALVSAGGGANLDSVYLYATLAGNW